jgi:peptidoglycan/xylan/chitin deacetylase (PgdA/CDA1 family)
LCYNTQKNSNEVFEVMKELKFKPFLLPAIGIILLGWASSPQAQLPVLIGHAHPSFGFDINDVTQYFQFLDENDYHTITPEQFYQWRVNAEPLPIRPVMITYDDNYIRMYTEVFPACQAYSMTVVNFAHTDYVGVPGSNDHADWDEIRQMENSGYVLTESHTRTHANLPTLSPAQLEDEILGSKLAIESEIPMKTCYHLAYPYGAYDSAVITETQDSGYLVGYSTISELNYRDTPLYEIRRIGIDGAGVETFKTRVGFYNLPPSPPGEGWTIDNIDPNFYADPSAWPAATGGSGQYGENYCVRTPGDGSEPAEWAAYLPEEGMYRVYARWPNVAGLASDAEYEVVDYSGATGVPVNQQQEGGQWNLLGSFYFPTDQPARVRLLDDGDGPLAADGVWFEPVVSEVGGWEIY